MLISPGDSGAFPTKELRSRSPKRVGRLENGQVKDGLSIGPLRATSGPPGAMVEMPSAGLSGKRQSSFALLDLPAGGQALVEQVRASVRPTNPLTSAISKGRIGGQSSAPNTETVQDRQIQSMHRFRNIDRQSRFLHARRHPFRQQGGFAVKLPSGNLSLLG